MDGRSHRLSSQRDVPPATYPPIGYKADTVWIQNGYTTVSKLTGLHFVSKFNLNYVVNYVQKNIIIDEGQT